MKRNINYSLSKYIWIGIILFCALTERVFAGATSEYVPAYIEQQIVEAALTTKPYSQLTQWLMQLYQSLATTRSTTLAGHTDSIKSVAISPDGSKVITGSLDNTAKIWNISDGSLVTTLSGHEGGITSVAISSDGSKVFTGSWDKTAKIWNMSDGSLIDTFPHGGESIAISPDGSRVVTGTYDGKANIWNMSDGSLIATLSGHTGCVRSVAITPDGATVFTGDEAGRVKIWNMSDGSFLTDFSSGHKYMISAIAISPDGSKFVTGSWDKTAKIWNTVSELFEALKKLTLKQVRLLEWLHELAVKGKKANFTDVTPINAPYIEQYALLPDLIQDIVKRYVKFE